MPVLLTTLSENLELSTKLNLYAPELTVSLISFNVLFDIDDSFKLYSVPLPPSIKILFNRLSLINESDKSIWDAQVKHITNNITDEIIDNAFKYFPKEVQDETIQIIKKKLQGRRKNLQKTSDTYFHHINKFQVIKGTDKDDWFEIERLPNSKTKVTAYRIKKGEKNTIFHQKEYKHSETKEIWIYGLDDKDMFVVKGAGKDLIKLRVIEGRITTLTIL